MATYVIVDTLLTDPELYEQYKLQAKPLVEQHGGEYLARGGAITLLEQDLWSPTRIVLLRFPDKASAEAFYHGAQYQEVLGIGRRAARRTVFMLEGL